MRLARVGYSCRRRLRETRKLLLRHLFERILKGDRTTHACEFVPALAQNTAGLLEKFAEYEVRAVESGFEIGRASCRERV